MTSVTSLLTENRLVLPPWRQSRHEPPGEGETTTGTAPFRAPASTRTELVPQNVCINPGLTAFLQHEMSRIFADTADRSNLRANARSRIEYSWEETVEEAAVKRSDWMETDISGVLQAACRIVMKARSSVGRLRGGPTSRSGPSTNDDSSWVVKPEMWGRLDEAKTEGVRSFHSPRFSHGPSSLALGR